MAQKPNSGTNAGKQLSRTLTDLESAIADWESLSDSAPPSGHSSTDAAPIGPVNNGTPQDQELREKTKKLLKELRKQLSDLT